VGEEDEGVLTPDALGGGVTELGQWRLWMAVARRARWGGTWRREEEMRTTRMGCGGGGRGWVPLYRVGEGEARRNRGGGWSAMVGIQFPAVLRSKRVRGVDGHRASAGE
jgi:hypothetical protein